MTTNSEEIKKLVREKYGARARGVIELTVVSGPSGGDRGSCGPLPPSLLRSRVPGSGVTEGLG